MAKSSVTAFETIGKLMAFITLAVPSVAADGL